jgi:hypothetical protein
LGLRRSHTANCRQDGCQRERLLIWASLVSSFSLQLYGLPSGAAPDESHDMMRALTENPVRAAVKIEIVIYSSSDG